MKTICKHCRKKFEYLHKFGEPVPECPHCGAKIYSPPVIIFKGKGFYCSKDTQENKEDRQT